MSYGSVSRGLGISAVIVFVLTAFTPVPIALFHAMRAPVHEEPAEAIVVLGGSVSLEGVLSDGSLRNTLRGITLFRRGLGPLLVLCGDARSDGPVEAEIRAALALELGVPPSAILTVVGARTTRGEADRVSALLRSRRVRRLLLVADSLHMARAIPLFERRGFDTFAAPAGEFIATADAPEARLSVARWLAREFLARMYYRTVGY